MASTPESLIEIVRKCVELRNVLSKKGAFSLYDKIPLGELIDSLNKLKTRKDEANSEEITAIEKASSDAGIEMLYKNPEQFLEKILTTISISGYRETPDFREIRTSLDLFKKQPSLESTFKKIEQRKKIEKQRLTRLDPEPSILPTQPNTKTIPSQSKTPTKSVEESPIIQNTTHPSSPNVQHPQTKPAAATIPRKAPLSKKPLPSRPVSQPKLAVPKTTQAATTIYKKAPLSKKPLPSRPESQPTAQSSVPAASPQVTPTQTKPVNLLVEAASEAIYNFERLIKLKGGKSTRLDTFILAEKLNSGTTLDKESLKTKQELTIDEFNNIRQWLITIKSILGKPEDKVAASKKANDELVKDKDLQKEEFLYSQSLSYSKEGDPVKKGKKAAYTSGKLEEVQNKITDPNEKRKL